MGGDKLVSSFWLLASGNYKRTSKNAQRATNNEQRTSNNEQKIIQNSTSKILKHEFHTISAYRF